MWTEGVLEIKLGSLEALIWACCLWQMGLVAPGVSQPKAECSHSPSLPFLPKTSFSASEVRCCPWTLSLSNKIDLRLIALPGYTLPVAQEGAATELPFGMWV